jgi:hypothetical protein
MANGASPGEGTGWDEVHGFASPREFDRFRCRIDEALAEGVLVEVQVLSRYTNVGFDEHWYRTAEGEVWRVVAPDFPFKGVFLQLTIRPPISRTNSGTNSAG